MRGFASFWLFAFLVVCPSLALAGEWKWLSSFTPASDKGLIALHEELNAPRLDGVLGIPVENVTWREELFELHMKSGAIYLEPPVQGSSVGAFFVGDAEVTFRPTSPKAREDTTYWFGRDRIEAEPITHVYFFSLREQDLARQLGTTAEPSVPLEARAAYEESKLAFRQLGTELLDAFLNREGIARDASWALFPLPSVRGKRSRSAYLLYSSDQRRAHEISLSAFGHDEIEDVLPHKYYFRTLVWCRSENPRSAARGTVGRYSTRIEVGGYYAEAEEETTLTFTPAEGVAALRLDLTPLMAVRSVTGPGGKPLPFLQWDYIPADPSHNYDPHLRVSFGEPLAAGKPVELRVVSAGRLFEPFGDGYWLAEEDDWHPRLENGGKAEYELFITIPKSREAVAAGQLIEESIVGNARRYHYRTSRPHNQTSLYFGDFASQVSKADETEVEVFVGARGGETKNLKFAAVEVANMIRVFNRLFVPIESSHLRVAATPTRHGRGFEGLILLSERAGFSGADSHADIFRAHEVAHQWWGNMVEEQLWPDDRWLSESFAEYAAMEYYTIRFESPEKTRQLVYQTWILPLIAPAAVELQTLGGERRKEQIAEISPLIDGGRNVYTKGPMVLQMLRYLFRVKQGNDAGFWELLREFLMNNRYETVTTSDFTKLAEQQLGADLDWFWDQWIYGSEIPLVRWTKTIQPTENGRWLLTVDARQVGSDYRLDIPVYIHLEGDRLGMNNLVVDGATGQARVVLPEKPSHITLNDNFEALVRMAE